MSRTLIEYVESEEALRLARRLYIQYYVLCYSFYRTSGL